MKAAFTFLILLLTALPAAAQVQPLTAWWIDTGETDSTGLGTGMAPLGDVNGDGYDDFVAAGTLGYYSGNLYVYYGGSQPDTVPHMVIPRPDSTLKWFGLPTFGVGDVNGDGFQDFIASGIQQELPFPIKQYAYLYFGGPLLDSIPDIIMINESEQQSSQFGLYGAGLGDINGDGFDDYGITDPWFGGIGYGAIYLYYGGNPPDSIPDIVLHANNSLNYLGFQLAPLGDVNQDGYADWVMSHPQCNGPNGEFSAGVIAIYYGGNPPDTIPHQIIYGSVPGANLGLGLTTLDWDGDGQADIFAWCGNFYPPDNHGAVWEIKVSPTMTGQPNHIFLGIPGYPGIGQELFHVDLDGDGQQDLISGAPGYAMAGLVYVFLNGAGQDTLYDAYYYRGNFNASLGHSGCNTGDVNGDGIEDMVIGEGNGPGRIHMILGSDSLHQSVGVMPFPKPPLPLTTALLKAFPNPFNPSTAISYELRAASYVSLKVYDTAGRLVTTLADGRKEAGTHEVTFDGSKLAAGVYIARLTAGEFTAAQKMVLLK
jgi:hypothetical protein